MKIQRYDHITISDSYVTDCDGMDERDLGDWVRFSDIQPLIERLRELEAHGWVKCSERMPERAGTYIGFVPDDEFPSMGQYDWTGKAWVFCAGIDEEPPMDVTHWMPPPPHLSIPRRVRREV